jgi:hypothetical protein
MTIFNPAKWASLFLIFAAVLTIIGGGWIGGTLGAVVIGGTFSLLGAFGVQWLTWVKERRFKVADIQRQAIYDLQDAMSEALRKLPDAIEANDKGQSRTDQSAIDVRKIVHEMDKLSSRVLDDRIKLLCEEYKKAVLSAFNLGKKSPSGYLDVESKLKEVNTRVRELMPSLFEGQ